MPSYFCYECNYTSEESEILRTPALTCPRCRSDFIEELQPGDPRANIDEADIPPEILNEDVNDNQVPLPVSAILQGLLGLVGGQTHPPTSANEQSQPPRETTPSRDDDEPRMPGSLPSETAQSTQQQPARTGGSNFFFSFSTIDSNGVRHTTTRQGGSGNATPQTNPSRRPTPTPHQNPASPVPVRTLSDFLQQAFQGSTPIQRENQAPVNSPPQSPLRHETTNQPRGPPTNLPQLLLSMLGGYPSPEGRPQGPGFQFFFGPGVMAGNNVPGQMGDFVFNQEGLDNVITRLMEQAGVAAGPRPATEDIIRDLPRRKLDDSDLALDDVQDCAICKEAFVKGDETLKLPCVHYFHQDCITPWLERSGTCPVCRYQLVEQPTHSPTAQMGPTFFFGPANNQNDPNRPNNPQQRSNQDEGPQMDPLD